MVAPSAGAVRDPDLALAIRLQQEELERLATSRQAAALGTGGAAAAGTQQASRPSMAGGASVRRGPSRQQLALPGGPPPGYPTGQPVAAPPARRAPCLNPTTLLLLATTVAWITLYIVSLADNGWNLGRCSRGGGGGGASLACSHRLRAFAACWHSREWIRPWQGVDHAPAALPKGITGVATHRPMQATCRSTPGQAPTSRRCWRLGRRRRHS